jgi:valacyclovir hydrolase
MRPFYTLNVFRYPEKVKRVVAHAGQSYISDTDMEKMMKVIDVSNWSARMREPMEEIYGKVSMLEEYR